MFQLVIALVFIAAASSDGFRIAPTNTNGSVANSLLTLANSCKNQFLNSQIKSGISSCNVTVPPYNELELQCLIFYDINQQLCDAVSTSKLALPVDYTVTITKPVDVQVLCNQSKLWEIIHLPDYPQFKQTIETVFKNMFTCAKVCGVPEITSQDSNFFCKYYKWGISVLNSHIDVNTPSAIANQFHAANVNSGSAIPKPVINNLAVPDQPSINNPQITTKNTTLKSPEKLPSLQTTKSTEGQSGVPAKPPKVSDEKDIEVYKTHEPKVQSSKLPTETMVQNFLKPKPSTLDVAENPSNEGMEKPVPADTQLVPSIEPNAEKKEKTLAFNKQIANEPKVDSIKTPEVDPDLGEDYQDSEDGKEGLTDTQGGDDGDDPMLTDLDNKLEQGKANIPVDRINTPLRSKESFQSDRGINKTSERRKFRNKSRKPSRIPESYASSFQDGFSDGDDHFFPVFLTGIILVVLLYVLYHNKNKVSKVVLGLIVEGRQSGARGRRGSRGHAYRRLDTLEQAMSAPSAAPPTKIIY